MIAEHALRRPAKHKSCDVETDWRARNERVTHALTYGAENEQRASEPQGKELPDSASKREILLLIKNQFSTVCKLCKLQNVCGMMFGSLSCLASLTLAWLRLVLSRLESV